MINPSDVAEKIYNILLGFGLSVDKYDSEGKVTVGTTDCRRYVVKTPNIIVRFSPETQTITLQTGPGEIPEKIHNMIQMTASDNLYNFDYNQFAKTITPRGEASDVENVKDSVMEQEIMEGFGTMTGSTKTSYQALDNVRLVLRHGARVNEESRGSRSRNIKEIYIQRGDERFKLAETNLKAGRAMARHIQQGGEMFDAVGESIVNMAREQRKLKEFVRYVNKRGLVNESNAEYVTLAKQNISDISESFKRLAGIKSYASALETINSRNNVQPLEEDNIQELFTETHFDDCVAEAMDSLRGAVSRDKAYQAAISEAISSERFMGFKEAVLEADLLTYETQNHKLAQRVRSLGICTESTVLRGFLNSVSYKISESRKLSTFETTSVRECMAKLRGVTESVKADPLDKLYATLAKYDY